MKKIIVGIVVSLLVFSIPISRGIVASGEKELKVGLLVSSTLEGVWNRQMMNALQDLKEYGYDLDLRYVENVTRENMETAVRSFCEEGYQLVILHCASVGDPSVMARIMDEYPKIFFLGGGATWKVQEPRLSHYDMNLHETLYLCGVIAGMMTKSNIIGAIACYPIPNVNAQFNAYRRGALSVNPDVKVKMSYLQSWYDPVKGKEAALAQIAVGADYIYTERDGPFQACEEKGVYVFGDKVDQHEIAPNAVVTSALTKWGPVLREVCDRVLAGDLAAKEYSQPVGAIALGYTELAPYYGFEDKLPSNVKDKVAEQTQNIKDGSLVIPYETSQPKPD